MAIIVSIVAVVVSMLQLQIKRDNLRYRLFDRRWEIYSTIKVFCISVLTSGTVKQEELSKLLKGTQKANFLVAGIKEYIKEIRDYAFLYMDVEGRIKDCEKELRTLQMPIIKYRGEKPDILKESRKWKVDKKRLEKIEELEKKKNKLWNDRTRIEKWFIAQIEGVDEKFGRYMSFD